MSDSIKKVSEYKYTFPKNQILKRASIFFFVFIKYYYSLSYVKGRILYRAQ